MVTGTVPRAGTGGFSSAFLEEEVRMKEKAQHLWSVLRNRVRSAVTKIKRADSQASVLSHGLHLLRHLFLPNPLTYMTYVTKEQCLVSLDSIGHVNVHHADGRIQRRVKPTAPFCGLLYVGEVQLYVAWDHQELHVLDLSFEPMSRSQVKQGVFCCVYEPESNQVLCGGCGGITVWTFGQGTRRLKCQMILSQNLTAHDSVTYIALGRTALLTQICFAACGSSIWEFSLSDGRLQRVTRNMHLRRITGLLYSEVLQLLISGSRDGDIKVWDKDMQLRAVYVGHTGPVTALALSSSGLIFYSGSEDETLRTWDLEIQEQVGEQHLAGKIRGFETFKGDQEFVVVYTSLGLDVWQVQDLYQLHTVMGTSVTNIIVYGGGRFPSRALCVCVDSAVRLLAASTGDVISTLLLDRNSRVKSAKYCMYRETVYVLLEQGDLLKANALKNPMHIVSMLKGGSEGLTPTCLTLYTCISDEERAYCQWRDVVDQRGLKRPGEKDCKYNPQNDQNRSIPIIGGEDGSLCVLDWFTNRTLCQVNAHHPEKVTCLISSPESSFVISAGSDFTVKVWRFFPYSEECFSPYMSFFCSQPIGHMCTLKSQLLVAFCDSSSATYSLVQYCLRTQTRMDHTPSDDHRDEITGLCSCPRLRLIASAGKDRMIRIWNEENQLLRTLCLSSEPESLAFRSDQGKLLLGIHSHVYHIDLSKLLPNPYQLKIMCLEPSVVDTQPHIAVTEDVLLSLSSYDKRRLTEPHSAYNRRTVGSIRINEETKARHLQTGEQSQEFARLSARDQELQLLQDGMLKPNKKRQSNKNTKREAMNKYMQLFYKEKPCVKIPDVDSFNSDAEQTMTNVLQVEDSALARSLCRGGFFPDVAPTASAEALSRDIQAFLSCRSIPNSAVVQLFWPSKILEKQHEVEHSLWRDILEHIPQGTDQAQTPEIMLKEEIKDVEDVRDDVEKEQDEELRNALAILQKITETEKISPPTEDTSRVLSPPLPKVKPKNTDLPRPKKTVHSRIPLLKPLPPKSPKKTVVIKEPVFDKPTVSPVPTQLDKPPTPCTYSPEVHTPVHEEQEVISPPLPFFVQHFQAKDWFTTICPETEVHMMSDAGFESRLLQGILYRDLPMRIEVLQALKILHQYGQLKDSMKTFQTLITVINQRSLNLKVSEDREFVFSCLRFMNDLFRGHKDLVLELLVTCALVHPSLRAPLVHLLWDLGLQDPHGFLLKEINTWDSWEVTENHRESLRQSVEEWLQNWTLKLQNFVAESLKSITLGAYDEGTCVKRHHMRGAGRLRDKPKRTQDQRASDIDVNTMEVLNYFCEAQLEKEMQVAPPRQGGTVLALPPIHSKRALMRLGETSAPFRRKYEDDAQLPPILQPLFPEIIHFIDLPLKKISLYPFSSMQDASDSQHNIRSLNQEVHKYFIQQRSFTHSYY